MSSAELSYAFSISLVAGMRIQASTFATIEVSFGYTFCYRASLLAIGASCILTPAAGLAENQVLFWIGIVGMLTLKFVSDFYGATSALLLVLISSLLG